MTDPRGTKTHHYFSSYLHKNTSLNGFQKGDHGLPLSRFQADPHGRGTFISSETCFDASCVQKRTEYVLYERDSVCGAGQELSFCSNRNRRVQKQTTSFRERSWDIRVGRLTRTSTAWGTTDTQRWAVTSRPATSVASGRTGIPPMEATRAGSCCRRRFCLGCWRPIHSELSRKDRPADPTPRRSGRASTSTRTPVFSAADEITVRSVRPLERPFR